MAAEKEKRDREEKERLDREARLSEIAKRQNNATSRKCPNTINLDKKKNKDLKKRKKKAGGQENIQDPFYSGKERSFVAGFFRL